MQEEGKVIEVNDGVIKVEVHPVSCEKCDHYQICNPSGNKKTVELKNTVNAKKGDKVILSVDNAVFSQVALLVYGVPVLGLIAGYLIGEKVSGSEGVGVVSGSVAFVMVYIVLAFLDRRVFSRKDKLRSRIIDVIRDTTPNKDGSIG